MSSASRRVAGILLVVFPTVVVGGVSLLSLLIDRGSGYQDNPLRQDLWRAGHAHAGVLMGGGSGQWAMEAAGRGPAAPAARRG